MTDWDDRPRFFARGYSVFNQAQVTGYVAPEVPVLSETERLAHAEAFYANLGIPTAYGGAEAYYLPSKDTVFMPPFAAFDQATPPDIHPNVSEIFRSKVARLTDTLNDPADRAEAAQAVRGLITRVIITPGTGPGELQATLEGELGAILEWLAQHSTNSGRTHVRGVSVPVVAGARNRLDLQLQALLTASYGSLL